MTEHHIVQFNVATMRFPLDHPEMQGFVEQIERLNRLAEESEGFVWRLQDPSGDSTAMRPMGDTVLINMSMWESIDALHSYTYRSDHGKAFAARKLWFEPSNQRDLVLWWHPAGSTPTVTEAERRLALIRSEGPCAEAFDFKHRVAPPG